MPGGYPPPQSEMLKWPDPNYVDPVRKPKYILTCSCVLAPISFAMLLVRLWVRFRIQRSSGWDDWLMAASWAPSTVLTVQYCLYTEMYKFDRHIWDMELGTAPTLRINIFAMYIIFAFTSGLIKVSVLLFYRRLSTRAVSTAFRWAIIANISIIGVTTVILMAMPLFECVPLSAFWNRDDSSGFYDDGARFRCLNEGLEVFTAGILSTTQDFITASIPAALCWNLQMKARKKISLYIVFAFSYLVVAFGAVRTYYSYKAFYRTYDATWLACDIFLWCILELYVGSMCANAPSLRVFYMHCRKHKPSVSQRSRSAPGSFRANVFSSKEASSPSMENCILDSHSFKQKHAVRTSIMLGGEDREDIEMGAIRADTYTSIVSTAAHSAPPLWQTWT